MAVQVQIQKKDLARKQSSQRRRESEPVEQHPWVRADVRRLPYVDGSF